MNSIRRNMATILLVAAWCCYPSLAQNDLADTAFQPYTSCHLPDGLSVVETAPLATGVTTRMVRTVHGEVPIEMLAGRRVMFAYPNEDFYANVKVEILPADKWDTLRKGLSDNFDYLLAAGDDARNYKLKPTVNGFGAEGQDRSKREGGVLGFYLLFENATHTAITIYFLNQEPPVRFKTMDEYAALRDKFLNNYTMCIRKSIQRP